MLLQPFPFSLPSLHPASSKCKILPRVFAPPPPPLPQPPLSAAPSPALFQADDLLRSLLPALHDLQHLVPSTFVLQRQHRHVRHQVPADLSLLRRVLPPDDQLPGGGLRLEAAGANYGVGDAAGSEVVLGDDLLVEDLPEGVGDEEAGGLGLPPARGGRERK